MLLERVVSAMLFGPLLLWTAWIGGWPLFLLMVIFSFLAHGELAGMLKRRDIRVLPGVTPFAIALVLVSAQWGASEHFGAALILSALLPLGGLLFKPGAFTLTDAAFTTLEIVYIGALAGYLLRLRLLEDGRLLLVALILTWGYDTTAYFVGRAWGRHKLVPLLSPKKTWEGAVGGAAAALGLSVVLLYFGFMEGLAVALGAGLVVTVSAPVGDLIESAIKRYAAVKDAGRILPGHGGVLDRFDSLLITGLALYSYFLVVLG